ncbi:hypothetical protein QQ045_023755 [Rhodiola kirilowii]
MSRRPPNGYSPPISPVKRPSKPHITHLKPPPPAPDPVLEPPASPEPGPEPIRPTSPPQLPPAPTPPPVHRSPRSVRRSPKPSKYLPLHRELQSLQPLDLPPSAPVNSTHSVPNHIKPRLPPPSQPPLSFVNSHELYLKVNPSILMKMILMMNFLSWKIQGAFVTKD